MKLLLAVSGGADSIYLASRAGDFFPGAEFIVAHCNFSLRSDESDGDESFVRGWCASHGIPCLVKRFDTAARAESTHASTEMAARTLRYEWFAQLCAERGLDGVVVAHNASDNAETMLLNLLRGTGTRGLKGMKPDSVNEFGCRVLRPMLDIQREEITSWLKEHSQDWREDRTNAKNDFKRNKLRNLVFPVFKEINPAFIRTLSEDMSRIGQVDDIADDFFAREAGSVLNAEGDVDLDSLVHRKHWRYTLWRLTEQEIGKDEFEDLARALADKGPAALSGKRFGSFTVSKGLLIHDEAVGQEDISIRSIPVSEIETLKVQEGTILMDEGKLASPLNVRPWQEGDWMRPLGMKGRKKISDLFVDLGWNERQKRNAKVVELEGNHVAALLCARIDESVKIDSDSSTAVICTTRRTSCLRQATQCPPTRTGIPDQD